MAHHCRLAISNLVQRHHASAAVLQERAAGQPDPPGAVPSGQAIAAKNQIVRVATIATRAVLARAVQMRAVQIRDVRTRGRKTPVAAIPGGVSLGRQIPVSSDHANPFVNSATMPKTITALAEMIAAPSESRAVMKTVMTVLSAINRGIRPENPKAASQPPTPVRRGPHGPPQKWHHRPSNYLASGHNLIAAPTLTMRQLASRNVTPLTGRQATNRVAANLHLA